MNSRTNVDRRRAFTLVELVAIAGVLAVVVLLVIPALQRQRRVPANRIQCVNRLKNVGLAFRIFATDNGDEFPFALSVTNNGTRELHANGDPFYAFRALSNELSTPKILICPKDKRRVADSWTNLSNKNLSYFISTNAVETNPTGFLAGDRNIESSGKPVPSGRLAVPAGSSFSFDKGIHELQGNVCMADGSVQQLSNARILAQTNHTGYVLLVP